MFDSLSPVCRAIARFVSPAPYLSAVSLTVYSLSPSLPWRSPSGPISVWRSRAPTPKTTHPSGPPTIVCSAKGGQWTKSHRRSARSWPSMISVAVPERTTKFSWSLSQWYIDIGWPGPSTSIPIPIWSKIVSPPKFVDRPMPSDSRQRTSSALTTNQPSPL